MTENQKSMYFQVTLTEDQWMLLSRCIGPHEDAYTLAHQTFKALSDAKIVWQ